MSNTAITGFAADTTPAQADLVVTAKSPFGAASNKKVTLANLFEYAGVRSGMGMRCAILEIGVPTSATIVGDGQGYFRIPPLLNGWNLVSVGASVSVAGTTNTTDIQLRRVRAAASVDMLSTKITIDSTEVDSSTAATPPVINAANDDVNTADQIYIDVDAISTTPAQGLCVTMTFQLP